MFIFPYNQNSQSAKDLAKALDIKRIKTEGSKFVGGPNKIVINWGSSRIMNNEVGKSVVVNKPEAVALATNKLSFFRHCQETGLVPSFTTDKDDAIYAVRNGELIVCRTILNGHSGEGIVLATTPEEVVDAPLYVWYIPKKSEYRVHVFGGRAVDVQRKARNKDVPDDQVNWKIRNLAGGFIFSRNEALGEVPRAVVQCAEAVVVQCGLDFGAVDVIYNDKYRAAYALEINTAPGLVGQTLENYQQLFSKLYERRTEVSQAKLGDILTQIANIWANAPGIKYE